MCAVSVVGDMFAKTAPPWVGLSWPVLQPQVTREEFDALKVQVAELAKLLKAAKAYDAATGQPDCEQEEKLELLRKVAKMVGVELGL